MPTFVALIDWTEQGVKPFRETVERYEAARGRFEELGVRLTHVLDARGARHHRRRGG
jgi:uncharacterized protein with GYD domain